MLGKRWARAAQLRFASAGEDRNMETIRKLGGTDAKDLAKKIMCGDCFQVMGVERGYDVAPYKDRFKNLQRVFHPDRMAQFADDSDREIFKEVSAKCNDCFGSLQDPYFKGCMLLKLETGRDVNDDERAVELADKLDDEFLSEMMDLKMGLHMAMDDEDTTELRRLSEGVNEAFTGLLEGLSASFAGRDYDTAELTLLKMNYFRKMRKDIKQALPPE